MAGSDGPKDTGTHRPRDKPVPEPLAVLRAKHRDYCSGRVFQIVQRMSPDEMFVFVKDLVTDSEEPEELSYKEMVRLATIRIHDEAKLPSFEDWAEEYRADPERFDAVLLDLWRSEEGKGARPSR